MHNKSQNTSHLQTGPRPTLQRKYFLKNILHVLDTVTKSCLKMTA